MLRKIKLLATDYSLLILILLAGGFLRFYNLNWDEGHFFHPDERNIALAVSRISFFDQLNPQFFAYGSFPIYLYRSAGDLLVALTHNPAWTNEWPLINLIGRSFSAFFSTLTIFLVFLLAKKLFDRKTALLASFLTAFFPSLIQTAHFDVTESLLTFWLFLLCLFTLELEQKPRLKNYLKIGFVLGLAIATKVSALSFAIVFLAFHFLTSLKNLKTHLKLITLALVSFLTFAFFSPYVFLDFQKFKESMNYEGGIVWGKLKVVYVLQFEETIPYFFQIKNFFWQMGPIVPLAILGIIVLFLSSLKAKDKKSLAILTFPLAYFFYVGSWYTKFIRYMVPLLPFLAIGAAWFLFQIYRLEKNIGRALIGLSCLLTLSWALAFFSIYTRESTRITASRWIYQNIPTGAKIYQEHWDDGLPITLPPNHASQYEIEQLTIYEPDNELKKEYYAQKLARGDYLAINSRRLYGTLIHLNERYPLTSRYYQLLFSGTLGYRKIAEFSSYPSLLGLEINDDQSEETFQVYDHPKVLIFQNQSRLTEDQIANLFQ